MKTVTLVVSGRVQGVGYRHWAVTTATRLGLAGWARNRSDGTVEAVAQGPAERVDEFIAACRAGPSAARVTDVRVSGAEAIAAASFTQAATV